MGARFFQLTTETIGFRGVGFASRGGLQVLLTLREAAIQILVRFRELRIGLLLPGEVRFAVLQLALGLPDLRSRLGACTRFTLKPLDDADRREVLKSQAVLRGIQLDDAVLDWLFSRYARDLGALLDLLDKLDQASLAAQRRITVPFLRDFLRDATEP